MTVTAAHVGESRTPQRIIPGLVAPVRALSVIPLASGVAAAERWLRHADSASPDPPAVTVARVDAPAELTRTLLRV